MRIRTGNRGSRAIAAQMIDLGFAVPQVMAYRIARMALAGSSPSARVSRSSACSGARPASTARPRRCASAARSEPGRGLMARGPAPISGRGAEQGGVPWMRCGRLPGGGRGCGG